ncbi:MAG: DUF3386 family protein [Planctomycetota bacterium]
MRLSITTLAFVLLLLLSTPVRAHFLWLVVEPSQEVQLHFSEGPYELTAPRLLQLLEPVRTKVAAGELKLNPNPRAWAGRLQHGGQSAGVSWRYGIFARGDRPFLLEYYGRGASSLESAAKSDGLRSEILATREGDRLVIRVQFDGKPVPEAEVVVSAPNRLEPDVWQANAMGELRIPLPPEGLLGLRSHAEEPGEGEHDGQSYRLVKHYTTLTVALDPVEAIPSEADTLAWRRLQRASLLRATLPRSVTEIAGEFGLATDSERTAGSFRFVVGSGFETFDVDSGPEELKAWARQTIGSMIQHRLSRPFRQGDGSKPVAFAKTEPGPLHETLALNDSIRSRYHLDGDRIVGVERRMEHTHLSIDVLSSQRTPDGQLLPDRFVVIHRDPKTGSISRVESIAETYDETSNASLPLSRLVTIHAGGAGSVRKLTLSEVKIR